MALHRALRQAGGWRGDSPSVPEDGWSLCHPQKCPSSGEGRSHLPHLQQSPAPLSPAAGCTARKPSSPTALLHFQRHKELLGTQLHPYLSAAISWCRFSSKPTASCSHTPASRHHHLTSISSPGTQERSWQLTKRRVTRSLGWSLPVTPGGPTPVGMGIPTRAWCHCHGTAAHLPPPWLRQQTDCNAQEQKVLAPTQLQLPFPHLGKNRRSFSCPEKACCLPSYSPALISPVRDPSLARSSSFLIASHCASRHIQTS